MAKETPERQESPKKPKRLPLCTANNKAVSFTCKNALAALALPFNLQGKRG